MGSNDEHFTYAMQLVTSTSLTMVLVNAIKLGVLEAIAEAGHDARLSAQEITSYLLIPNKDAPNMLDRMLMLLASHSIVTCSQGEHESKMVRVYGLAPVAKYFIQNENGVSLGALMEFIQDKAVIDSWFKLKDSVVEGGVPFDKVHGIQVFEYLALDTRVNKVFSNAMVNYTTLVMKEILECYHGFDNLKNLVDVGGGVGAALNMIISKHPTVNGINFDLPHVLQQAPLYLGIKHVGGDMFLDVPQSDAIFMKLILHDWSNHHCIKLLKNCYKALPDGGKVIIVESILPFLSNTSASTKATTHMDALMMTLCPGGKERTEDEFLTLAKGAGFNGINKECHVCGFWVMELYK